MNNQDTNKIELLRAMLKAGVGIRMSSKATQTPLYQAEQLAKELQAEALIFNP